MTPPGRALASTLPYPHDVASRPSSSGSWSRRARGIGTWIGNGWLREPPRPRPGIDLRGRSALRKCMFMEVPDAVKNLAPRYAHVPLPPPPPRPEPPLPEVRRDPAKFAREFPAFPPPRPTKAARPELPAPPSMTWWEDPIAIGTLLIVLPPLGLSALWSSRRYSTDARWALTVMTALTMCLAAAVLVALTGRG
jgi:hypothetical protein